MKKEFREPVKIGRNYYAETLRQGGYNNYEAIADIMDNSLEDAVNAKNVNVVIKHERGERKPKEILIIDDGCGMDLDTLAKAMDISRSTGKDEKSLGMYGVGLKSASLSMGRRFKVYTKTSEMDRVLCGTFDIDNYDGDEQIRDCVSFDRSENEYKEFCKKVNGEHGTIVKIDKLDRLTCSSDYNTLIRTLSKNLRITFCKLIEKGRCVIKLNGKKLEYFDIIGNKRYGGDCVLTRSGEIVIGDVHAKWLGWNLRKTISDNQDNDDGYGRGSRHQGITIYRNDRVVCDGVTLGLFNKDDHTNGFRLELYIDGNADKILKTGFTKIVGEKKDGAIDDEWSNELKKIIKPLLKAAKEDDKALNKESEIDSSINENVSKTLDALNKNEFLRGGIKHFKKGGNTVTKGRGEREGKGKKGIQQKKRPWIDGWEFASEGENNLCYRSVIENNKNFIKVNTDHPWFKYFFSKLNHYQQEMCIAFVSMGIQAKHRMGYYDDEHIQYIVDDYNQKMSDFFKRAMEGLNYSY